MRLTRFFASFAAGVALGVAMLIAGGLPAPAPQSCPGCAVLTHATVECHSPVEGGWTC